MANVRILLFSLSHNERGAPIEPIEPPSWIVLVVTRHAPGNRWACSFQNTSAEREIERDGEVRLLAGDSRVVAM